MRTLTELACAWGCLPTDLTDVDDATIATMIRVLEERAHEQNRDS